MDEPKKPPPPNRCDADPSRLVKVGGPVDRSKVSLRLFGDSLVPAEVTRLLCCEPTRAFRKGDVEPDKRYHRVASQGSWLLEGALPENAGIEEQVAALLGRLTNDLPVWQRLTTDFRADVFCGVFLEEWSRGFGLSPRLTKMLGERGLEIGFDIFCL